MEVSLNKRYPIKAAPERAWAVLRDLHAIAACMPGASITEQLGPQQFKGTVRVKVGPVTALFNGEIEVLRIEETEHRISINGKGFDKGGSTAAMHLTTSIEKTDEASGCALVGKTQVTVNGRLAQFGGRMLSQVSDLVLDEFVGNFARAAAAGSSATAAAPAKQLNALTMLWQLVKGWVCRLTADHCHGKHA